MVGYGLTSVLCVSLLQITQPPNKLFARNILVVGKKVVLSSLASIVDEDVCVGGHSSDGADHVAWFLLASSSFNFHAGYPLVENVKLLSACVLLQELACNLPFRSKNNSILCEDT
jgi:hypothetical protein